MNIYSNHYVQSKLASPVPVARIKVSKDYRISRTLLYSSLAQFDEISTPESK